LEIINQDVTFTCLDGSEMVAHLSRPEGAGQVGEGKRPAIIVIHEAYGLNEQIKGVAHRYAEAGFVAVAPNLFTRDGDTMTEKNIESAMRPLWSLPAERRNDQSAIQALMKTMSATDRKVMSIFFFGREEMEKQMVSDLLSCTDYLKGLSFTRGDRLGITGFCLGGGLTYQVSAMYPFSASVPFYGNNPSPLEAVANISGPILAFYAGEDERVNAGVPALVEAMLKHKKSFEMKVYKGAQHSFFNETRPVYSREAAEDSWRRAMAFFNEHLLR